MGPLRRPLARLVSLLRSGRAEAELAREIEAHLRLLEDQFVAEGMAPEDARYAAKRAFGGVEQAKEHHRDARSFRWLAGWPMDLKLGVRMLMKYPGLTIVAVIALAVAIGSGAAFMEFVTDLVRPTLPFKDGHRVVGIVNWDIATGAADERALHEFARWRRDITTIVDLGAAAELERNLITEDGRAEPVRGAEISASAFRVIPIPPLLGRPLRDEDELASAPPVAVIREDLWRTRFDGDPAVVGRNVRFGRASYTVVGVMPASFGFPVNQTMWVPLQVPASGMGRGEGPAVVVFGRLAPDVGIQAAQAELVAAADRAAADLPAGARRLRPVVKTYVASIWSTIEDGQLQQLVLYTANLLFVGLLALCGANVATLVFARTVTREAEITVRTALGASRGRIVSQLFAEALVLSSIAAVAGLAVASFAGRWGKAKFIEAQRSTPPFWWSDDLSPETLAYAAVLAIVAAAIVGVVPALKATGACMQSRLKSAGASGPRMKFGGVWTVIIVGQVAVTVLFLMAVVSVAVNASVSPYAAGNFAFRGQEYVTFRLELDRDRSSAPAREAPDASAARLNATYRELERRLELDPSVRAVSHTTRLPGGGWEFILEMDPASGSAPALAPRADDDPLWVRSAYVGADFFEGFDARIVSGRGFTPGDADVARKVAVVDRTFVRTVLGGRDPVGLRLRRQQRPDDGIAKAGPWYEIVGVVTDLGTRPAKTSEDAMLYLPTPPGAPGGRDMTVVVRGRGDASSLAAAVRRVAAEADPTLRLYDVMTLPEYYKVETIGYDFMLRALALVSAVALLLSTAGVYALMSFTLSRRTREIGIRAALGAAPLRIVTTIFSRALVQIGLGVLAGSVPGYFLVSQGAPELARGGGSGVAAAATLAVGLFIATVAAGACVIPARRALRVQPTEALRAD